MDLHSKTPAETLAPPSSSPSQFTFTITRTAVSQICQYIGFKGSNVSALQTLTHIATLYLQSLAKVAASHATNSNRTDSNLFDVILALEDLASVQGFPGAASDASRKSVVSCTTVADHVIAVEDLAASVQAFRDKSPLRSGALVDIMNFVDETYELPFAKPIPRFNPSRRSRPPNSLLRKKMMKKKKNKKNGDPVVVPVPVPRDYHHHHLQRGNSHIPRWLPPFPDPSTYEKRREYRFSKSIDDDRIEDGSSSEKGMIDEDGKRKNCEEGERKKMCELLLPEKQRGRVGFKIGLGDRVRLNNGVCRGSRKRICMEEE